MKALFLVLLSASLLAHSQTIEIHKHPDSGGQLLKISGTATPDSNFHLHFSHDARSWFPIAGSRTLPWQFIDSNAAESDHGFYRVSKNPLQPISSHSSWRESISLPDDPFRSDPVLTGFGQTEIRWIKFSIVLDNTPTVYFQDGSQYQFHYNFANNQLDPFSGISLDDFNDLSLHPPNQEVVLGAVLFAPTHHEFAIEFVGRKSYPPEMLRYLYELADAAIERPDDWSGYYFPTFEQAEDARAHTEFFERNDIRLGSIGRWQNSDACYSDGWALGRLVFVPGAEIDEAFLNGSLLSTDILITDGVPAEVPYVAGIVSTAPGTPNSHVAILARSYGVPFVYLSNQIDAEAALDLVGQDVVLRANSRFSGECTVDVFEAKDVSPDYRAAILALKKTPPLKVTPYENLGTLSMDVASATLPDIRYIGGKAANFSLLRQTIPESSPKAIALTFDLWSGYLAQSIEGKSLRETIATRLAKHTWPPNIAALDADLKAVRDLIKKEADFSSAQKNALLTILQTSGFDLMKKLRFRSSTNVEDSEEFVGAGLYDSYSGCLQDDLDDDDEGPSHCDPGKENERGVFRAIRKVYASFYNLNAYLERLRRGVTEDDVGMAILVHHSFPDETEAANGVITGRFQNSISSAFLFSEVVTQLDAESVTNPNGNSIPELVESNCVKGSAGLGCSNHFLERSSLLPLGRFSIMDWQEDYSSVNSMALLVAEAYQAATEVDRPTLEFEFKKLTDDSLVIKQVRRVPELDSSGSPHAALINRPVTLEVFQGERADIFSNHNLKLRLNSETASRFLDRAGTSASFLTRSDWQYHNEGRVQEKNGVISEWDNSDFAVRDIFGSNYAVDSWTESGFKGGSANLEFRHELPTEFTLKTQPIQTTNDLQTELSAEFTKPQLTKQHGVGFTTTSSQFVVLVPSVTDQPLPPGSTLKNRNHQTPSKVEIDINLYWPPSPTGPVAGYTAPLQKWDITTITGLTTEPIELRGYYSQTYRPGHHNFTEEFLLEPRLENGLNAATLAELENLDIKQLYLEFGSRIPTVKIIGFDNKVRDLN